MVGDSRSVLDGRDENKNKAAFVYDLTPAATPSLGLISFWPSGNMPAQAR